MSQIAILHPQCARLGGAIQMALQTAQVLLKQGHKVVIYTFEKNDACFPELQTGLDIRVWDSARKIGFLPLRKLVAITSLAWELRHVDIIIANNPPMQIVAALTKFFLSRMQTIWWHHHVPWYMSPEAKNTNEQGTMYNVQGRNLFKNPQLLITHYTLHISKFFKRFVERNFVIPRIDQMIATSYFVAEKIQMYCGREATVIHPIIQMNNEEMKKGKEAVSFPSFRHSVIPSLDKVTLFTHGRLEPGKGIDMIVRVWERMNNEEGIVSSSSGKGDHCDSRDEWEISLNGISSTGIQENKLSATAKSLQSGSRDGLDLRVKPEGDGAVRHPRASEARPGDPVKSLSQNGERNQESGKSIRLLIFGTGSLEKELREKGIDVRPFDRERTFQELGIMNYEGRGRNSKNKNQICPLDTGEEGVNLTLSNEGGKCKLRGNEGGLIHREGGQEKNSDSYTESLSHEIPPNPPLSRGHDTSTGHVLGVYCSQIDAFGMAPLEAQAAGISTLILDSGGARETILTNLSDEPVGYLVESEEELFRTIKEYVQIKSFPKKLSNVNFSHTREYFTPERLSSDISSIIEKTRV